MYELKVVRERRTGYGSLRSMRSSHEVYELFQRRFAQADREEFIVVPLDAKNRVLGFHVVSVGSLTSSLVHPRECFKVAILANAAALILVHNHPSGDPKPSSEDLAITKRLGEIGELMGIRVLDHVVVGDNRYVSFVDDGLLSQGMLRTAA
jgi:DNA repair protein RadC